MYSPNSMALLQTVATSVMLLQRSSVVLTGRAVGRGSRRAMALTRWRAIDSCVQARLRSGGGAGNGRRLAVAGTCQALLDRAACAPGAPLVHAPTTRSPVV